MVSDGSDGAEGRALSSKAPGWDAAGSEIGALPGGAAPPGPNEIALGNAQGNGVRKVIALKGLDGVASDGSDCAEVTSFVCLDSKWLIGGLAVDRTSNEAASVA